MVQMKNVTMVYENSDVAALDNFSLTINEGEFAFLVGPSGSPARSDRPTERSSSTVSIWAR